MSGQLQSVGDDGPLPCAICGGVAAGPCASCHRATCGDCSVLTEGGAKLWAICLRCDKRGGRSLMPGWAIVLSWIAVPIVLLAVAIVILGYLTRR